MKKFLIEFNMDGERYGDDIMAESLEDAEKRLRCIKGNGRIIGGPVLLTIPVPFGETNIVKRFVNWLLGK